METPLAYIQQRVDEDWLIGCDRHQLLHLSQQLCLELSQQSSSTTPPRVLLAERNPLRFLAGFIAATTAGCPVFLGNPDWVETEWQQVLNLVQPQLIWGQVPNSTPFISPSSPPANASGLIMIPTGGSSGQIRFTLHTWETLMASVQGFSKYFQIPNIHSFCVLPLYHVSGLMQFLRSLTTGGRLVILPFKALETEPNLQIQPSEFFISLVPTQLQRLLNSHPIWLAEFKTVLLGGSPAWNELLENARFHKIQLAPTYGMTETASQIVTLKPADFLQGNNSCGQVLPHAKVTVHNSTGEILTANQTGLIAIQADSLCLGYYPNFFSDLNGLQSHTFQPDDLGFLDEQDYLHIVGRNSNKIITGGENVFPAEVEAAILATQLVKDVCVIGLPDSHWGQIVTAIYVPSHSQIFPDILQTVLKDKLSKFKQPKSWIPLGNLPRNAQGKINFSQLTEIAILKQK
jgi:O-succinylbenzoic acid--CoA ligase